jgi:polyhydroxyalkanoate synthesis regulator phasin
MKMSHFTKDEEEPLDPLRMTQDALAIKKSVELQQRITELEAQVIDLENAVAAMKVTRKKMQNTLVTLEEDKARLREALKTCSTDWRAGCYGTDTEMSFDSKKVKEALATTSSTWLAEHDAEERRKVVDEILNEAQGPNKDAYIHSEHIAEVVCRMAKGNRSQP